MTSASKRWRVFSYVRLWPAQQATSATPRRHWASAGAPFIAGWKSMESDPTSADRSDSAQHRPHLRHRNNTPFERRVRLLCVFIAAPAFVLAAILLWQVHVSGTMIVTILGVTALLSLI